ncbi:hypothetical protein ACFVWR_13285 [Leifsonia sp. NPDC058292]|uniref:hypothetical protein n=1 Tax=Leifsonia sp. NPDC058292 TaxID=3346428 RepID=UPI0036DF80F2
MTSDEQQHAAAALRDWARGSTTLVAATELLIRSGFAQEWRPWVHFDEFYDLLQADDQYELEGTAIAAREIIERCDNDRMREINLGLVWAEADDEHLNE